MFSFFAPVSKSQHWDNVEQEGLDAAKRVAAEKAAAPPMGPSAITPRQPSSDPEAMRARRRRAADKAEKNAKAARQASAGRWLRGVATAVSPPRPFSRGGAQNAVSAEL